eukprot:CAMPEP_0174892314 /NCGR_PEP_ID=MMETSP0167-20121228/7284_1 /TAXON_ID=38298 /ORGANISM="Rhodella maculata, Strain CCMP736" /LENGTH=68 /DNA_ID=CAMNT_0016130765 /DNA_START=114 /DNA_END=320 /DNA_ORIENTATION=+
MAMMRASATGAIAHSTPGGTPSEGIRLSGFAASAPLFPFSATPVHFCKHPQAKHSCQLKLNTGLSISD